MFLDIVTNNFYDFIIKRRKYYLIRNYDTFSFLFFIVIMNLPLEYRY